MPEFRLTAKDMVNVANEGINVTLIKKDSYEKFNESILGLGKIESKSKQIDALSVFFDLEGFTNFCNQIDPKLAVPEYLSEFLKWIFIELRKELTRKELEQGFATWADLPFFSKYLGDGLLFLWDTEQMGDVAIRNVVVSMLDICKSYTAKFLPKISKEVASPPSKLRCGVARGSILSVGDNNDFVGPCINLSSRLQKLDSFSFCFARRGINPSEMGEYKDEFVTLQTDIRGVANHELICVLKTEYELLTAVDKKKYRSL